MENRTISSVVTKTSLNKAGISNTIYLSWLKVCNYLASFLTAAFFTAAAFCTGLFVTGLLFPKEPLKRLPLAVFLSPLPIIMFLK